MCSHSSQYSDHKSYLNSYSGSPGKNLLVLAHHYNNHKNTSIEPDAEDLLRNQIATLIKDKSSINNELQELDTENTQTGAEGRWTDGDKIRFRKGLPQKIGGWTKFSEAYYVGVGRALEQWFALDGARYEALGTDRKIYVYQGGDNQDITPIRATANIVNAFTTSNTSSNVVITHSAHGAILGDFVTITNTSTAVGGIPAATLDAEYEILEMAF